MKKINLFLILFVMGMVTVNLFSACGSKTPTSQVNAIVADAEKNIPLKTSPCLGNIPSLQLQYKEANRLLKEQIKLRNQEIEDKFKDGGSMEDAMRQSEIIRDERKVMEKELKDLFTKRIMSEAKKIEGTAIPCYADGVQYNKVTGKLVCSKDSSIISTPLIFEAEAVLEIPFKGPVAYCSWVYQDAQGKEIIAGAYPINNWKELKSGDKFTQSFPIAVTGEKGMKLKQLYFKK